PADFDELMQILDKELRLVTPTDPEGAVDNAEFGSRISDSAAPPLSKGGQGGSGEELSFSASSGGVGTEIRNPEFEIRDTYYQLTHDFLVPSVRRWLVRRQQETRRGRAELLLAEKTDFWMARPERRYLPSWWQWLRVRTLTSKADWTTAERAMMRSAGRTHLVRGILLAIGLALVGFGAREGYQY